MFVSVSEREHAGRWALQVGGHCGRVHSGLGSEVSLLVSLSSSLSTPARLTMRLIVKGRSPRLGDRSQTEVRCLLNVCEQSLGMNIITPVEIRGLYLAVVSQFNTISFIEC